MINYLCGKLTLGGELARLRPLTTSYTPYQPERSQGTLQTHWIYQCALSALTGFEAINTSLYDRSFAIYESILCAIRTSKRHSKVLLSKSLFENDIQVLETLAEGTGLEFSFVDINPENGKIDLNALHSINEKMKSIRLPASFSLKSMHLAYWREKLTH